MMIWVSTNDKTRRKALKPPSVAAAQKWNPMRAALRTLTVLRALNLRNGATVGDLSEITGISRPALYRILETLREEGYVSIDIARKHYCLTMLVRTLAEGFSEEDWVTQVARPALAQLQRKVVWPSDLGTFSNNAMWIRETTRPLSPLTIDRGVAGTRFSMLSSATGRAYLAFCRADERKQILKNLESLVESGNGLIWRRQLLDAMLADVRKKGYGYRWGEPPAESGAISVPILHGERIYGCVTMTFMSATLTPEKAAKLHLQDLQATAQSIARGTQELEVAVRRAARSQKTS
jgi:IclR family transcriptional regulator, mhp operon transcriptional activator